MHEQTRTRPPELVPVLLVSFLSLLTFGVQYVSRRLDDNRLTSWQWLFPHTHPAVIAALIAAGCAAAYLAARSSFPDRRPMAFLLLLSYGTGVLFWSEPEVLVDTARYFTQAKHLELYGVPYFLREWGRAVPAWTDLPLLPFLYGLLFSVFGESRIWIQAFTTALFSLTVASTYLLGRTLWDEDTGFIGGLLLLGMPYLFTQVPLMLVDVGTMCFFTLAVLAVVLALRRGDRCSLAGAVSAVTLALLAKYSTWMLLSVLGVVFVVQWFSSWRRDEGSGAGPEPRTVLIRTGIIAVGTALLTGAVLFFFRDVVAEQFRLLLEYQRPGFARWSEGMVSTFFFQVHPLISAAALYSLIAAVRKRDPRYLIIGWTVLLLLALRIERIRYLLTVFPMLALMAAYGIREIDGRSLRRFVVFCVVAGSVSVAAAAYLPFLRTVSLVNLREAGAYLDSTGAGSVEVETLPDARHLLDRRVYVPILDLYTKASIRYRPPRETAPSRDVINVSSLRFTWELRDPGYYAGPDTGGEQPRVIAVISSFPDQELTSEVKKKVRGYRRGRTFGTDEGVYQSKTFVTIYEKAFDENK